jgi:putative ABC transport system permease protein
MNELFGVSMTTIMLVMLALLGASLAVVGAIYLFNPTVARLGLRNIPRRPAQSVLIVVGLMLSTLIITAAFTVGDSLDRSITREVYDIYQRNDLEIDFQAADTVAPYVPAAIVPALEGQVAGDPNIDGFLPAIFERVPVLNPDTRLSEPRAILAGLDPERIARAGGLRDAAGRPVDLAALPLGGILINSTAADLLDAAPGSAVVLLVNGRPHTFTVAAVVRPELLTGRRPAGPNSRDTGGLVLPLAAAQDLLGKPDQINYLGVANRGGVRAGVERTPAVIDTLTPLVTTEAARQSLGLTEVGVSLDAAKQRAVAAARTAGSLFTAVFLLLGLFSIGAGMLLVFMIFVMLAAERKMEMGMARAIGLRRSHLVQSFIAEGMAYNIVAGLVGLGLGIGAAYLLVVVGTRLLVGGAFAVDLVLAPRSLIVSYAPPSRSPPGASPSSTSSPRSATCRRGRPVAACAPTLPGACSACLPVAH